MKPTPPLAWATGSCSFVCFVFFSSQFKSKREGSARTVPGLALFMVPYEHIGTLTSPPSLLLPAYRGHIHPRVGAMRRAGGEWGRRWGALQLKGIFFNGSICAVLKGPFQSPHSDQIKVTSFWHEEAASRWVPSLWQGHSIPRSKPVVGGERESKRKTVRSLQGLCFVFAVGVEAFCMVDAAFRLSSSTLFKCLTSRATQCQGELWIVNRRTVHSRILSADKNVYKLKLENVGIREKYNGNRRSFFHYAKEWFEWWGAANK